MTPQERRNQALQFLGITEEQAQIGKHKRKHPRPVATFIQERPKMIKKRAYFSCEKKTRYRNEGEAHTAASRIRAERGVELRAYPCFNCDGWHLTKQVHPKGRNK